MVRRKFKLDVGYLRKLTRGPSIFYIYHQDQYGLATSFKTGIYGENTAFVWRTLLQNIKDTPFTGFISEYPQDTLEIKVLT